MRQIPLSKPGLAIRKPKPWRHIKLNCGGLLIDSPMTKGGKTNTGLVAKRFFDPSNGEAICDLVACTEDREILASS